MKKPQTLEEIYNSLPKLNCKGKCTASCGIIPLYEVEAEYIEANGGKSPRVSDSLRFGDLSCSNLKHDGKCSIYDQRPFMCRLFGLVRKMQCPYGCIPDRWLSDKEAHKIMNRLQKMSGDEEAQVLMNPIVRF